MVNLIAATTTETGLEVKCARDRNSYPSGVKVTKEEMKGIRLRKDKFHGEWNYTILPAASGKRGRDDAEAIDRRRSDPPRRRRTGEAGHDPRGSPPRHARPRESFHKDSNDEYETDAFHDSGFQVFYGGEGPVVEYIELSREAGFRVLYRGVDVFQRPPIRSWPMCQVTRRSTPRTPS